jgi:hypothetical protein
MITRHATVRNLFTAAAGLWLLCTLAGCALDPGGPSGVGFAPTEHHRVARRVVPCGPSQGYHATCWHFSQVGCMAGRACEIEAESPAGAVPAAPNVEMVPTPAGMPQPAAVPLPPGAAEGSRDAEGTRPDAKRMVPAIKGSHSDGNPTSPFEDEKTPVGPGRTQPDMSAPEKTPPGDGERLPRTSPAAGEQSGAEAPGDQDRNPALLPDREAQSAPRPVRLRLTCLGPPVGVPHAGPAGQGPSPTLKARRGVVPASCLETGSEAAHEGGLLLDREDAPVAKSLFPADLFAHQPLSR